MPQDIFQALVSFFTSLAHVMPLEVYVFVGSFVEELLAPIPQSLIVVVAGTLAKTQGYPLIFLLWLAFLSAVGKMIAGWGFYILGDKAEHVVVGKFGRALGVTEKEIMKWSKYVNHGWRDILFLFLARIIPVIPTAPVSVVCGIMKSNFTHFLLVSVIGLTIRNWFFLYLGYLGVNSYKSVISNLGGVDYILKIVGFVVFLLFLVWMGYLGLLRRKR